MAQEGKEHFSPRTAIAEASQRLFPPRPGLNAPAPPSLIDIRILELLTARLCHELSGPIAAINNGVELLTEDDPGAGSLPNPALLHDAVALVGASAQRARSRLQFYRFAYGFTSGSTIAGQAPCELATGFFAASRIAAAYPESVSTLSPDWQKLACNMLLVGGSALQRGGRLVLTDAPLAVEAIGEAAALSLETQEALVLATPITLLNARTVQPYFTGLLAAALAGSLVASTEPGRVRLEALSHPAR